MRMIERDDALMDYSANIDMLDLRNKLYDAVIKESASIKTEDFNIFILLDNRFIFGAILCIITSMSTIII